eukprot:702070-Rhodomonas_salina.2
MWKQQRLGVLGGAAEVRSSACVPTLADSLLDLAGTTMEDVEAVTDSRRGQSTLTDFYPARKAPSQKITKPLEGTSKLSPSPRTSEQACSDPQAGKENDSHVCPPPPRTTPRFQSLMSRLQKNAKEFENGVPWQRFTGNVLSSARRSHGRIISRCIETVQFEGPLPDKFEGRPLEEPENESFAAGRVEAVHAVSVASSAFSKSVFLSHNPPNVPQPRNFKQAVSASCPETSTNASAPAGPSSSAPTLHRLDILSDVCSDHRRAERVDPGGGGGGSGEVPWPSAAQVMQGLDASNGGKRERDKMHRETEWRAPLDRPQSRPSHEAPSSPCRSSPLAQQLTCGCAHPGHAEPEEARSGAGVERDGFGRWWARGRWAREAAAVLGEARSAEQGR